MALVIKATIGALVVLLIGLLSKTKNYYIAGIIPLFPTFALIAHYIVATERGVDALRTTIVFGMCCRCGTSPDLCGWDTRWALRYFAGASAPGCSFLSGAASTSAAGGRHRRQTSVP